MEPLPVAPGQEPFGSWDNFKAILRADPWFGALLVLLALEVLLQFLTTNWFGAALGGAMFWGVLTFRWWGWLVVVLGAGLGLLGGVVTLATAGIGLFSLAITAVNAFVVIVMYRRRDRFD